MCENCKVHYLLAKFTGFRPAAVTTTTAAPPHERSDHAIIYVCNSDTFHVIVITVATATPQPQQQYTTEEEEEEEKNCSNQLWIT